MPQRVIIAGGGRVGARTARILGDHGHDPVVVERDTDRIEQLDDRRHGVVIGGDATRRRVLSQADPARADTLAALTGDEVTNRAICDRASALTDDIETIARVEGRDGGDGVPDRTVLPAAAGAKATADAILDHGHWLRDLPATGFDLAEFGVDPRAPAARKRLDSVGFPDGCQVVADVETMTVAGPGMELRPGHRYLVAVESGAPTDVRNLMRG